MGRQQYHLTLEVLRGPVTLVIDLFTVHTGDRQVMAAGARSVTVEVLTRL